MNNCIISSKNIVGGEVKAMKRLVSITGSFMLICIIITSVILPSLPRAGAADSDIDVNIESVVQDSGEASEDEYFLIKNYKGKVAVFEGSSERPFFISDVSVNNLPKNDREILKDGIRASTKREINRLIEDYCS